MAKDKPKTELPPEQEGTTIVEFAPAEVEGQILIVHNDSNKDIRRYRGSEDRGPTETWHFTGDMPTPDPCAPRGKGKPLELEHPRDLPDWDDLEPASKWVPEAPAHILVEDGHRVWCRVCEISALTGGDLGVIRLFAERHAADGGER